MPPPFDFPTHENGGPHMDELDRIQRYMLPILLQSMGPVMNQLEDRIAKAITEGLNGVRSNVDANNARLDRQNERLVKLETDFAVMKAQALIMVLTVSACAGIFTFFATYFSLKH